MEAKVIENPPVEKKSLFCPPLEDVANVLNTGMKSNFTEVQVDVVDCPDLTQQPFTLACKGLGGRGRIVDVGGPPYLLPLVQRDKLYDMKDIIRLVELDKAFVIGAGAGPWPFIGRNCEMMANLNIEESKVDNQTRIAQVNTQDGTVILDCLPNTETRTALLSNLYCSEGNPGKVLRVSCKIRHGSDDFITCIRKVLNENYKGQPVGLGGTFLLKEGKAKQHVMPDFSTEPITSDDSLNEWLHFYNMSAPLIAVGTLVSEDPGLDLRVQHFHSFSHHGEGGHYHYDTEPKTVEYLGYFALADLIYRVDRPVATHNFGRD